MYNFITLTNATQRTGLSRLQIHALSIQGIIPPLQINMGYIYVDMEALQNWIDANPDWVAEFRNPSPVREHTPMTDYLRSLQTNA